MIELLYSTLVIFSFPIVFFFCSHFQTIKFFLLITQFILWLVLCSNILYKKHILWKEPEIQCIHSTPFLPIKNLIPKYSNGVFDYLDYELSDGIFSINQTDEYSKECLENYL